jgi:hypothetical protein
VSNGDTQTDVLDAGDKAVTQPADRALGYGNDAVAQGKTPSKPPAKKPKPPTWFELAKQALATLAKDDSKLANVELRPWAELKNKIVKNGPWDAWTNSDTVIYVRPKPRGRRANSTVAFIMIYHETRHILDFRANGLPQSYFEGWKAELKAQQQTFDYAIQRAGETELTSEQKKEFNEETNRASDIDAMEEAIAAFAKIADPTDRDLAVVKAWIADGYIPAAVMDKARTKIVHQAPDLYKPSP